MMQHLSIVFEAGTAEKVVLIPTQAKTGVRFISGKVVTVGARGADKDINILHGATVVATGVLGADGVEAAVLPVTAGGADKKVFLPGTPIKVQVEAGTACTVCLSFQLDPFLIS